MGIVGGCSELRWVHIGWDLVSSTFEFGGNVGQRGERWTICDGLSTCYFSASAHVSPSLRRCIESVPDLGAVLDLQLLFGRDETVKASRQALRSSPSPSEAMTKGRQSNDKLPIKFHDEELD